MVVFNHDSLYLITERVPAGLWSGKCNRSHVFNRHSRHLKHPGVFSDNIVLVAQSERKINKDRQGHKDTTESWMNLKLQCVTCQSYQHVWNRLHISQDCIAHNNLRKHSESKQTLASWCNNLKLQYSKTRRVPRFAEKRETNATQTVLFTYGPEYCVGLRVLFCCGIFLMAYLS